MSQTISTNKGIPSWVWVLTPIVLVAVAFTYLRFFSPVVLADFAKCLTEKGAIFYGMFDCPHCLAQKSDFGRAMQFVTYVECKLDNGTWADVCKQENITSTPTWKFNGKDPITGRQSLQVLADKTSCPLPEGIVQTGNVAKPSSQAQTNMTIQPVSTPVLPNQ